MDLLANPFFVLGATMGDPKRRIMALAEEKNLGSDSTTEAAVRDAKAMLTHPKRRLRAEIAWLPGLPPKRISETIATLQQDPAQVRSLTGLPSLARANLLAAGLIRIAKQLPKGDVAQWILELARVHEAITAEATMNLLNEERSTVRGILNSLIRRSSGFLPITDPQMIDAELRNQRQYYGQAIKKALDLLPFQSLVEVVTTTVDEATNHGNHQAPILIDDLVDRFEVEAQGFFETETKAIKDLMQRIRRAAERDGSYQSISRLVSQLEDAVKNWDRVAQPIQVSARSRGTDHDLSHEVSGEIRSLAVHLFNKHDLLAISRKLTALLQVVFAEVPSVVEKAQEDASKFDKIAKQKNVSTQSNTKDRAEQLNAKSKNEKEQTSTHWMVSLGNRIAVILVASGIVALLFLTMIPLIKFIFPVIFMLIKIIMTIFIKIIVTIFTIIKALVIMIIHAIVFIFNPNSGWAFNP